MQLLKHTLTSEVHTKAKHRRLLATAKGSTHYSHFGSCCKSFGCYFLIF